MPGLRTLGLAVLGLAVLGLVGLLPASARCEPLVADLSDHLIAITTGFTGASVVLFGATDGPGDIIAVVRGPQRDVTIWRKGKVAGIWANRESVTFADVPSFYAVAATRPLDAILPPAAAVAYRIGVENLQYRTRDEPAPDRARLFADALTEVQQNAGLFHRGVEPVAYLGDRLFRATLAFPANVPTGNYEVEVFLVRDRRVVDRQTTPLAVSKVGLGAAVFDFARRRSLAYGAIAVMMAATAGWLASVPFRNP